MSLDKAIASGDERRKPFRKSKRFDKTCRNHGSCSRCEGDRTYRSRKQRIRADEMMENYKDYED
jgi:hypothetical protein